MTNLFRLNDFQYEVNNKLTLIQACALSNIDIPRFCFHESLSIAGNCRMCLVEDLNQLKPLASCAVNVSESMFIYTNTAKVKRARESVLEFLLVNHPLDCPICDQGGECDLQDQSLVFGSDRGRFYEFKRSVEDKDLGSLVKTVMNRCIHCTRCVRFGIEIAGVTDLGVTGRGSKMEIGSYISSLIKSELSGNIIDLCPVGALTSKPFSFKARSWELKSYNSIDVFDSFHSNIRIDIRGTKIMRILPRVNNKINNDWISDRIRFSYDSFRTQRLMFPALRIEGKFIKLSWVTLLGFLNKFIFELFKNKLCTFQFFIGTDLDIESAFMLKNFLSVTGSYISKITNRYDFENRYVELASINDFNVFDFYLLTGVNLRISHPLLNVKVRASLLKRNSLIYLVGYNSNFNFHIKHVSTSVLSLIAITEGSHWLNSIILFRKSLFIFDEKYDSIVNLLRQMKKSCDISCLILNNNIPTQEIGLVSAEKVKTSTNSIAYLINNDKKNVPPSPIQIYHGHHGDIGAFNSNMILPCSFFIEQNSTYLNMFGIFQQTKTVLFAPGDSRDG